MSEHVFLNNPLREWVMGVVITLSVYILACIAKMLFLKWLGRRSPETPGIWGDLTVESITRIHGLFLIAVAVYVGMLRLSLPENYSEIIHKVFVIALLVQIAHSASHAISFSFETYRRRQIDKNAAAVTTLSSVAFLFRILLWMTLLLVGLDNLGVNVTTVIAGLGVGGIAVALAVQNILGDLFASFSIVLDKPFVIGDFIIVDDNLGTVEHVGLKTTRIRSLSGEQLIFSNADLLGSRIRNFKRMYERRVVFSIGVLYQTPVEKIAAIPDMLRTIIEAQEQVHFDRAHFKAYGAYSLVFEVVYWVHSPDYNIYMDIQQAINIAIFKRFDENKIRFAYPTQTVIMEGHPLSQELHQGGLNDLG